MKISGVQGRRNELQTVNVRTAIQFVHCFVAETDNSKLSKCIILFIYLLYFIHSHKSIQGKTFWIWSLSNKFSKH